MLRRTWASVDFGIILMVLPWFSLVFFSHLIFSTLLGILLALCWARFLDLLKQLEETGTHSLSADFLFYAAQPGFLPCQRRLQRFFFLVSFSILSECRCFLCVLSLLLVEAVVSKYQNVFLCLFKTFIYDMLFFFNLDTDLWFITSI